MIKVQRDKTRYVSCLKPGKLLRDVTVHRLVSYCSVAKRYDMNGWLAVLRLSHIHESP